MIEISLVPTGCSTQCSGCGTGGYHFCISSSNQDGYLTFETNSYINQSARFFFTAYPNAPSQTNTFSIFIDSIEQYTEIHTGCPQPENYTEFLVSNATTNIVLHVVSGGYEIIGDQDCNKNTSETFLVICETCEQLPCGVNVNSCNETLDCSMTETCTSTTTISTSTTIVSTTSTTTTAPATTTTTPTTTTETVTTFTHTSTIPTTTTAIMTTSIPTTATMTMSIPTTATMTMSIPTTAIMTTTPTTATMTTSIPTMSTTISTHTSTIADTVKISNNRNTIRIVLIVATIVIVIIFAVGILVYIKKNRHTTADDDSNSLQELPCADAARDSQYANFDSAVSDPQYANFRPSTHDSQYANFDFAVRDSQYANFGIERT